MDQHVALAQLPHDRHPWLELTRPGGTPWRKEQRRIVHQIHQLIQAHQVHRTMHTVQGRVGQIELLQQKVRQKAGAAC